MKKVIIIFLLFFISLFGEWEIEQVGKWEIEKNEYVIGLTKESTDKKAELQLSYGGGYSGASVIIKSEKKIKKDAKIVVEYKYFDGRKKTDDKNYRVFIDGYISVDNMSYIINYNYSDLSFNGYFSLATTLTVYANKKKLHTFDLEDLYKLLIKYY